MKRTFLAFFLLVASHLVSAQDEQALRAFQRQLRQETTSVTEKDLSALGLKLEQVKEEGDASAEVSLNRELGLVYLNRAHNYDKAIDYFIRALHIGDSLDLQDQQVLTYVAMSRVFEVVGDYFKSGQFLEQALSFNKDGRHINVDALILNSLGRVHAAMGNLELALQNFQQVLRYRDDIDKQHEAEALFNLAHLFTLKGNYDQALEYHRMSLRVNRVLQNKLAEATSLNDIGVLYALMKNDEKCEANHRVALDIRKRLDDDRGIAESYNNIGTLYLRRENPREAIAHGLLALEHARESQAREQMLHSYDLLSQAYKVTGDFQKALEFKELGVTLQDFIQSEKHERQLLEAQNRYVVETKENEIQKLDALRLEREREIAAQKKFRNILFLAVALACMSAGLLLVLFLVKQRANRKLRAAQREVEMQNVKLQELNHTKDKFFSIISHDLKGPLNSLTSFSRLLIDHTDSMTREEIQLLAKDLDKSVGNLLALLENLLEWSRSQTGSIDFTRDLFDLGEMLHSNKKLLDAQAGTKQINIIVSAPSPINVRLHKNSVNTVIRNLISNAIKFTPPGGAIRVGAEVTQSAVRVSVADNGVGMSPDVVKKLFQLGSKHSTKGTANEKGTGLGLILCKEFIEKNGGQISVQSVEGKGTSFTCSFPATVLEGSPAPREQASISL